MQLSKPAKIALILGILLILAVILVLWINKKNSQNTTDLSAEPTSSVGNAYAPSATALSSDESVTPGESATEASNDQINYISVTPTVSVSASATSTKVAARTPNPTTSIGANGVVTYEIDVTPAPNAGPYDWTRTVDKIKVTDITNTAAANKSACEIVGLSGDWSNIIGKISCDTINFLATQVIQPMMEMSCALNAQVVQSDTGRPVTYEFKNSACLIIDRP